MGDIGGLSDWIDNSDNSLILGFTGYQDYSDIDKMGWSWFFSMDDYGMINGLTGILMGCWWEYHGMLMEMQRDEASDKTNGLL